MFSVCCTIICGLVFLTPASHADPPCYGPGDLDGDDVVGAGDLDVFAECMAGPDVTDPPPGCNPDTFARADLDADGDVDLRDFAILAQLVGATFFDYGPSRSNLEAEMLAMDVSGELRAPDAEYERILGDLALIRDEYSELRSVIDDEDYVPDQLLVGVDESQPLDEYYALNSYYRVVDEEIHSFFRLLTFCDNLNMRALGNIYSAVPGVNYGEPNWWIGIDDYITIDVLGSTYRYNIDDGFWDCFDGCDCHREWVIDVDESGTVTLISYDEWGQPWCDF